MAATTSNPRRRAPFTPSRIRTRQERIGCPTCTEEDSIVSTDDDAAGSTAAMISCQDSPLRRAAIRQRPGTPHRRQQPKDGGDDDNYDDEYDDDDPESVMGPVSSSNTYTTTTSSWPRNRVLLPAPKVQVLSDPANLVVKVRGGCCMTKENAVGDLVEKTINVANGFVNQVDLRAHAPSSSHAARVDAPSSQYRFSTKTAVATTTTTSSGGTTLVSSAAINFMAIHKEFSKALARRQRLRMVHLELQQQQQRRPRPSHSLRAILAQKTVVDWAKNDDDDDAWEQELEKAWAKENKCRPKIKCSRMVHSKEIVRSYTRGPRDATEPCHDFDPSAWEPKAPPDAYSVFSQENRPAIEAEHPDLSRVGILSALRAIWADLPACERQAYLDQEAARHAEYRQKLKAWKDYQKDLEKPVASTNRKNKTDDVENSRRVESKQPSGVSNDAPSVGKAKRRALLSPTKRTPLLRDALNRRATTTTVKFADKEQNGLREYEGRRNAQQQQQQQQQQKDQENAAHRKVPKPERSKKYTFVLREPLTRQADGTYPQPRGRKPAGHVWDGFVGTWISDDCNDNYSPSETTGRSLPAKVLNYGCPRKPRSENTAFATDSLFSLISTEEPTKKRRRSTPRQVSRGRKSPKHTQLDFFSKGSSVSKSRPSLSSSTSLIRHPFLCRAAAKLLHLNSSSGLHFEARISDDGDASFGIDNVNVNGVSFVGTLPRETQNVSRSIDEVSATLADHTLFGGDDEEPSSCGEARPTTRSNQIFQPRNLEITTMVNPRNTPKNRFTANSQSVVAKAPFGQSDRTFAEPLDIAPVNQRNNRTAPLVSKSVPVSAPRFIPCGCCVGCKMTANCDACLQCLLRTDASPDTRNHFVCMQRICSAPRRNPDLVHNDISKSQTTK